MNSKLFPQSGFALYTTLTVLGIVFFVVVGISTIFLREIQVAYETGNSAIAFMAAESGIERALYAVRIAKDMGTSSTFPACTDNTGCVIGTSKNPIELDNGSSYYVTVMQGDNAWCTNDPNSGLLIQYCIRSIGRYGTSSRALEVHI